MYLKEIALKNIKCFADFRLEFTRSEGNDVRLWTALLGQNGLGKSTLLQAIAVALAGPEVTKLLLPRPEGWVRVGEEQGIVEATILPDAQDGPFRLVLDRPPGFLPQEPPRPRTVRYVVTGDRPTQVGNRYFDSPAIVEQNGGDFDYLSRTLYSERGEVQGWLACGYGPFRRLSGGEAITSSSKAARYDTLFREGAALTHCQNWLEELDHRAKDGDTYSVQKLERVKKALADRLLPEEKIEVQVSSKGVTFQSHGHSIPMSQLSDGYRSMLALSIDLLRWLTDAFPNAPNPMDCPGIVLIDELDAHVHPAWQRQIGHWLRQKFPRLQFIIATHSPFLAQVADDPGGNVVLIQTPEGVQPRTDVEAVETWRADQILTELFDVPSTRSPQVEHKLQRHQELYRERQARQLSPSEEQEYQQLSQWQESLPPPLEDPAQRRLAEALQKAVERLSDRIREAA